MTKTDLPDDPDSTEMAEARTAWAEDRTVLANERTFAGWMRTGMACIGLALGLKAVFQDTDYPYIAKAAAEVFIFAAILIFWAAVRKCQKAKKRMRDHDVEAQSNQQMLLLASILTFSALSTGAILWLL